MRILRAALILALLCCGASGHAAQPEYLVAAAISLKSPVEEALGAYAAERPGTRLVFNFAASGVLERQLHAGAPVDLALFADEPTMELAVGKNLVVPSSVAVVATNKVVFAFARSKVGGAGQKTQPGDEKGIERIAVGNPDYVPLGRYVKAALVRTRKWDGVREKLIFTASAEQTLAYLAGGEVDAAYIYETDARKLEPAKFATASADAVEKARYFVGVATRSAGDKAVWALRDHLLSPEGQARFSAHGFGLPVGER